MDIHEVAIQAGQIRMRPFVVTQLTMMAGAAAILFDPSFESMAISLLLGAMNSVTLTIPDSCIKFESNQHFGV